MTDTVRQVRILGDASTPGLLAFARGKLKQMHEFMRYAGLPRLVRAFTTPEAAVTITASEIPGVDDRIELISGLVEHVWSVTPGVAELTEAMGSNQVAMIGNRVSLDDPPPSVVGLEDVESLEYSLRVDFAQQFRSFGNAVRRRDYKLAEAILDANHNGATITIEEDVTSIEDETIAPAESGRYVVDGSYVLDYPTELDTGLDGFKQWPKMQALLERYDGTFSHEQADAGAEYSFQTTTETSTSSFLITTTVEGYTSVPSVGLVSGRERAIAKVGFVDQQQDPPGAGMVVGDRDVRSKTFGEPKFWKFRRLRFGWTATESPITVSRAYTYDGSFDSRLGDTGTLTATFSVPLYADAFGTRVVAGHGYYRVTQPLNENPVSANMPLKRGTFVNNDYAGRVVHVLSTFVAPRSGREFRLYSNGAIEIIGPGDDDNYSVMVGTVGNHFPVSNNDYLTIGTSTAADGFLPPIGLYFGFSYDATCTTTISGTTTTTYTSAVVQRTFDANDMAQAVYKASEDDYQIGPLSALNHFDAGLLYRPRDEAYMLVTDLGAMVPTMLVNDGFTERVFHELYDRRLQISTIPFGTSTLTVTATFGLQRGLHVVT